MNLKDQSALAQAIYKRYSAMTPLVLVCALLVVALAAVMPFNPPVWLLITLSGLLCVSLFFFCGVYVYFLLKQPDKLHSEDYLLEMHNMTTAFEDRGEIELVAEDDSTVEKPARIAKSSGGGAGGEGDTR